MRGEKAEATGWEDRRRRRLGEVAKAFREVLEFSDAGGGQVVWRLEFLWAGSWGGGGTRASFGLADRVYPDVDVVGGFQLSPA